MRETKFGHDMINGFDFDEFYTFVKECKDLMVYHRFVFLQFIGKMTVASYLLQLLL